MVALEFLHRLAEGKSVPSNGAAQLYTTSAHSTDVVTARTDGAVILSRFGGHAPILRLSRGVDLEKLREAARRLVQAGFPNIEDPSPQPPPPTMPPVRIVVHGPDDDSIDGEVPAWSVTKLPAFGSAAAILAELGRPLWKRAEESATLLGALDMTVQVKLLPPGEALRMEAGTLWRIGQGERGERKALGDVTFDEQKAVGEALRAARYPHHGAYLHVPGPHHELTVEIGDVAVQTTSPVASVDAAIRALDAIGARLGVRVLGLP